MFCQNCGNKLDDDAKFCPKCGTKTSETSIPAPQGEKDEFFKDATPPSPAYQQPYQQAQYQQPAPQQPYYAQQPVNKTNTLAIVGFVLSFFVAIAGLICSIIGLKQCNQTKEGGKGLAIAGVVISSVSMAIFFLLFMFGIFNLWWWYI